MTAWVMTIALIVLVIGPVLLIITLRDDPPRGRSPKQ